MVSTPPRPPPAYGFFRNEFFKERVKPWFCVTFNVIIRMSLKFLKLFRIYWKFHTSILIIFVNFPAFLIIPYYKETNEAWGVCEGVTEKNFFRQPY